MAQDDVPESTASGSSSSSAPAARLNAAAPEFTPRSAAQHHNHGNNPHRRGGPHHHHHQPHHHHYHHHQPHQHHQPRHQHQHHQAAEDEGSAAATAEDREGPAGAGAGQAQHRLPEPEARKLVKQVEFYFSDINLATTEHLMKFIAKDPDGFVPISVVASFRKIREIVYDRSLLVAALRTSSELAVSEDGKHVKRVHPFNAEEVQSRIVVAENLPEDQKHQTLMKIFSAVGSVKSIRTCYPQDVAAANKTSRIEMLFANKLHAFVEYSTVEDAEKAVAEFGGGANWRGGIRVRSLLGCLKHGLGQGRKGGDEEYAADEDGPDTTEHPQDYGTDVTAQNSEAHFDHQAEDGTHDKGGMSQHGRGRGRGGRGRGRGQYYGHNNRDAHHPVGTPTSEHPVVPKPLPGPRMPDGTRGFTMGRGKPLNPTTDAAANPTTDVA